MLRPREPDESINLVAELGIIRFSCVNRWKLKYDGD